MSNWQHMSNWPQMSNKAKIKTFKTTNLLKVPYRFLQNECVMYLHTPIRKARTCFTTSLEYVWLMRACVSIAKRSWGWKYLIGTFTFRQSSSPHIMKKELKERSMHATYLCCIICAMTITTLYLAYIPLPNWFMVQISVTQSQYGLFSKTDYWIFLSGF